jgi:hypothetical protein
MNEAQITQTAMAHLEQHSTAVLMDMHAKLEGTKDANERRISALVAEVIITRTNIAEAIDAIYEDIDFDGTFHQAIKMAIKG